MASGKSVTGKELAEKLGLEFLDMDEIFERRYTKIGEYFEDKGEEEFRKREREILLELMEEENVVIATGGGTPCFFDNMERMKKAGITIYLKCSLEILYERLSEQAPKRPLLKGLQGKELRLFILEHLWKREKYYSQAKFEIQAGLPGSFAKVLEDIRGSGR